MPHTHGHYSSPPMLIIGTDKTDTILEHLPESFLLVDDGPVIDHLLLRKRRRVTRLDLSHHALNPLKGIDYLKARQFVGIINAVFPEGESTLTRKNSTYVLLKALLGSKTRTLETLLAPSKDPGEQDAYQKIQTLLLSPILKHFLCTPTTLRLTGRHTTHNIILARLDRATLGDFDCFVLGNLLISAYSGPVVIPDFGFYAIPHHIQLMRQERLIAGLNTLSEKRISPEIRQQLLLVRPKLARRCAFDDAETLASYAGIPKHINAYSDFIDEAMR
jgi:hypothetical protein